MVRDLVFFGMWLQSRLIQVNDPAIKLFILKLDNNFILIQVYLGALWWVPEVVASGPGDYGWKLEIIILKWKWKSHHLSAFNSLSRQNNLLVVRQQAYLNSQGKLPDQTYTTMLQDTRIMLTRSKTFRYFTSHSKRWISQTQYPYFSLLSSHSFRRISNNHPVYVPRSITQHGLEKPKYHMAFSSLE